MAQAFLGLRKPQPSPSLPVLSAGCDWLTTTTRDEAARVLVGVLARHWINNQAGEGYKIEDFAWNGYIGQRTEGISYGDRDDGTLVRLSGDQARLHGDILASRCDHVSRVDFQVTLQDDNLTRDWAEECEERVSSDARISGGQTVLALVSSNRTKSTLYLGRRISDRFYRVYDKHAESNGAWPEGTWRFEVEYKGTRAEHWGDRLGAGPFEARHAQQVVADAFRNYGFNLPTVHLPRGWDDRSPRRQTTDEGRIRYLGTCIRPMVQKLREAYGTRTLRDLLDLGDSADGINVE